jgi:hypothetical protein
MNRAAIFNRWVDKNAALPPGHYTHDQLRSLLWLAWNAALDCVIADLEDDPQEYGTA